MKRRTAKFFLIPIFAVFLFAPTVFALDVINPVKVRWQENNSDYYEHYAGFNTVVQTFGGGLVGKPYSINLYVDKYTLNGANPAYVDIQCTDTDTALGGATCGYIRSATTTITGSGNVEFLFATTSPVQSWFEFDRTKYYRLSFYFQGSSGYARVYGDVHNSFGYGTSTAGSLADMYFQFYAFGDSVNQSIPPLVYNFGDATSTLEAMAGRCAQSGNIFAEGLCTAGVFLFVPSQETLTQFAVLKDDVWQKFPFSYVGSVMDTWDDLVASSTANMPVYVLNLGALNIGTSTPIGNLLPNFTFLSTSTILQYASQGQIDALKGLASLALILGLVADIYFSVIKYFH